MATLFAATGAPSAAEQTVPVRSVMNAVQSMKYDTYLEHPVDRKQALGVLQQRIATCQSKKESCVTGIGLVKDLGFGNRTMAEILIHTGPGYVDVFNRHYVGSSVPKNTNGKETWRTQNTGHAQEYEAATGGQFQARSFKGEGLYVVEGLRVDSSGKVSKIDLSDTGNLLKPFGLAGEYAYQHRVPSGYQPRPEQTNVAPAAQAYDHGKNNVALINPGLVESRARTKPSPNLER